MLKAAGIEIYNGLNVHGFWNVKGSKMSKSIGNVTDPLEIIKEYGLDPFRYFLMREMAFGLDANFTEDILVTRINSDLANDLGNLFSRVLSMTVRYFKGEIQEAHPGIEKDKNLSLAPEASKTIEDYKKAMTIYEFHKGVGAVWQYIRFMNKYIDTTEPWVLAKHEDTLPVLETVLYNLIEGLRVVSCLIYPIMPGTSVKIQKALAIVKKENEFYSLEEASVWGQVKKGTLIQSPEILFPRIDTKRKTEYHFG